MSSVFSVGKMAEFLRFCKIVESCLHLTFNVTGKKIHDSNVVNVYLDQLPTLTVDYAKLKHGGPLLGKRLDLKLSCALFCTLPAPLQPIWPS